MQTPLIRRSRATARLAAGIVMGVAASLGLSGCAAGWPTLDAKVAASRELSPCEAAYRDATEETEQGDQAIHAIQRYRSLLTSADAWLSVAEQCPVRFEEGVLRAAEAGYRAAVLAPRVGVAAAPSPQTPDMSQVVALKVSAQTLDAMSLVEDRAGFATEVLAARKTPGVSLSLSDNHKSVAERLHALAGTDTDPRLKVYAVDELLGSADADVVDPTTGLIAPAAAIVEMDAARAHLAALRDNTQSPSHATLELLARFIASRAWRAFDLGYPALSSALFADS